MKHPRRLHRPSAFTSGANAVATAPCMSVRASKRADVDFCFASSFAINDRSMSCGKSIRHSWLLVGRIRTDDVAELALVALVEDALVLRVAELARVVTAAGSSIISNNERKLGQSFTHMRQSLQMWKRPIPLDPRFGRIAERGIERVVQVLSHGGYDPLS